MKIKNKKILDRKQNPKLSNYILINKSTKLGFRELTERPYCYKRELPSP